MNCPYCGNEMQQGYVQGTSGVLFSPDEKVLFIRRNPFGKSDITVAGYMVDHASRAHYCYNCDCMIWFKKEKENIGL